jgi:hypothetical protein
MHVRRLSLRRSLPLTTGGEARLYARVQQEDGHRIWTSPIHLMCC